MLSAGITVRFDDRNMHNRNVKVNSQGYRPSFPKLGYFGGCVRGGVGLPNW